jgi:hypothetical protein
MLQVTCIGSMRHPGEPIISEREDLHARLMHLRRA